MWVVVGLGNPGREYAATRHNLGFRVVDVLLGRAGARARRGAGDYQVAQVRLGAQTALLVKPTTYVNRSGQALAQVAARRAFGPDELLAVVDDVWLPFGRLRLRPAGSAGGHNGLRSVIASLGTDAFARLRLGVGAPDGGTQLPDYVLAPFTADERRALPWFLERAADAVELVLASGVERALPAVNAPAPD